jgi:hypothetical protein
MGGAGERPTWRRSPITSERFSLRPALPALIVYEGDKGRPEALAAHDLDWLTARVAYRGGPVVNTLRDHLAELEGWGCRAGST